MHTKFKSNGTQNSYHKQIWTFIFIFYLIFLLNYLIVWKINSIELKKKKNYPTQIRQDCMGCAGCAGFVNRQYYQGKLFYPPHKK